MAAFTLASTTVVQTCLGGDPNTYDATCFGDPRFLTSNFVNKYKST